MKKKNLICFVFDIIASIFIIFLHIVDFFSISINEIWLMIMLILALVFYFMNFVGILWMEENDRESKISLFKLDRKDIVNTLLDILFHSLVIASTFLLFFPDNNIALLICVIAISYFYFYIVIVICKFLFVRLRNYFGGS